jgi:hypothetical protein
VYYWLSNAGKVFSSSFSFCNVNRHEGCERYEVVLISVDFRLRHVSFFCVAMDDCYRSVTE